MGWKKKTAIFLLPIVVFYTFKFIKANFLLFVLIGSHILPRLPFESYKQLNPDINDFATPDSELLAEYDFVIVGAGSAGAVVANRLSENESWKILLLEAGGEENLLTEIPALFFSLISSPFDWGYQTTAETISKNKPIYTEGRVKWPRGKVLGGTSAINGMAYTRGNRKDYDSWEEQGNPGWSYKDVLTYFKKSEDNRVEELADSEYHSKGGYLTIEPTERIDIFKKVMEGCNQVLHYNPDYNGEKQTGCVFYQNTKRDGQRCSTAKAFLNVKRPNLHISPLSHVHKINIDPDTKVATGLLFKKNGKLQSVSAKKEVVLSGGTVGSPQVKIAINAFSIKPFGKVHTEPSIDGLKLDNTTEGLHLNICFKLSLKMEPKKQLHGLFYLSEFRCFVQVG